MQFYRARVMGYSAILEDSQQLAIANLGDQTQISLTMISPGQQQSQSSSFSTGKWSNKPKLFQSDQGFILQIAGGRGLHHILIQQNSIIIINSPGDLSNHPQVDLKANPDPEPIQPMQPMQLMQPLKMGNMSMDINSMSMQMGNMSMGFGSQQKNMVKQFCSQCGVEAKTGDRFCHSCGHELNH